MNVTTVDNNPSHFYQSGNVDFLLDRTDVTIIHKHSSILTCRGFDHAVVIPSHSVEEIGCPTPADG